MTKRKWIIRIPLLLVLASAIAIGAYLIRHLNTSPQSATLPDGSVVELAGVTYGKIHHSPSNGPWTKIMEFIPPSVQHRLGIRTPNSTKTTEDSLVVWLRCMGRTNTWNGKLTTVSQNGHRRKMGRREKSFTINTPNGIEHWTGLVISIYPRRDPFFRLQLSDWSSNVHADFNIPNPRQIHSDPFRAEPLPTTETLNQVEFTLVGLEVVDPTNPPVTREREFRHGHDTRATFEVKEHGKVVNHWVPRSFQLEDATGNKSGSHSLVIEEINGKRSITFATGLYPGETWKIRTQFTHDKNFIPEDIWTVDVPLPSSSNANRKKISRTIQGKTVTVLGIPDKDGQLLDGSKASPSFWVINPKERVMEFHVDEWTRDIRLDFVECIDNLGRTIKPASLGSKDGRYFYKIKYEEDASSLTCKIAVHGSVYAEFIAEPTIATREANE